MTRHTQATEEALAGLDREIKAAIEAGARVPCIGRDEWIAGDAEALEFAAHGCQGCLVFDLCDSTAIRTRATAGVWAGKDRSK